MIKLRSTALFFLTAISIIAQNNVCVYQKQLVVGGRNGLVNYVELSDSSLVFVGYCDGITNTALSLTKVDKCGELIWYKKFYPASGVVFYSMALETTADHGFMIAGLYGNFSFAMKLDSLANPIWQRNYYFGASDARSYELIKLADTSYLMVGMSYQGPQSKGFIIQIDAAGSILQSSEIDFGCQHNVLTDVESNLYGDIFIIGISTVTPSAGYSNLNILKLDETLNPIWAKTYDCGFSNMALEINSTNDGGMIISGMPDTTNNASPAWFPTLTKIDSAGNVQWSKYYTSSWMVGETWGVVQNHEGNYYMAIEPEHIPGLGNGSRFGVICTDSVGIPIWTRIYNKDNWSFPFEIGITADSCVLVIGEAVLDSAIGAYWIKSDRFGYAGDCVNDTLLTTVGHPLTYTLSAGFNTNSSAVQNTFPIVVALPVTVLKTKCQDTTITIQNDSLQITMNSYVLFPNPNNGEFWVVGNFSAPMSFIVYDYLGRLVYEEQLVTNSQAQKISIQLASACYIYQLTSNGSVVDSGRFVIVD